MGACYSTAGDGRRDRKDDGEDDEDDSWWKSKSGRKINRKPTDLKFKFGGGGRVPAAERGLYQVPGRIFGNGSSRIASLYTQQGKKGTNQDAMIVWEKFSSASDSVFCGVFDGHGPYGHMVARKVRDSLPVLLSTQWNAISKGDNCVSDNSIVNGSSNSIDEQLEENWCEKFEVEEKEKLPEKHLPLKNSILKAFKLMDKELMNHPSIDCFCSGTTAVALIKQAQDILIGNLGDSRAVLATRDNENSLVAVQLTVDLKPNLPREAARIQQFKGRVFALQDEPEVARVWLPNSDSPGLAMARAFGDFCLKDFGLISVPDVYYHNVTDNDDFVILATDGVWDVLSNKEAVDIVASAPSRSTAARALVDCATRAWRLKYPTSKNDDCAAICLFLDHKPQPISPKPQMDLIQKPNGQENDDLAPHPSVLEHSATVKDSILPKSLADQIPKPNGKENDDLAPGPSVLEHSGTVRDCSEIVPDTESTEKSVGGSKRSLAECITMAEDEEWSALEGVTRVNSLLSIPRLFSAEKRSQSEKTCEKDLILRSPLFFLKGIWSFFKNLVNILSFGTIW